MNLWLTAFLSLTVCANLTGQDSSNHGWYDGVILAKNGDSVIGEIYYDHLEKVVIAKDSSTFKTYSSRNIDSFRFYDTNFRLIRTYSSVEYYRTPDFLTSEFFELVVNGNLSVLREGYWGKFSKMNYTYYAFKESALVPFKRFQNQLLPDLVRQQPELKQLIEEKQLKSHKKLDRLIIIDIFNALSDSTYERKIGTNYATRRLLNDL